MRKYIGKYILLFVICLVIGVSVYCFIASSNKKSEGQRNTLMNRVANEMSSKDIGDIEASLADLINNNDWAKEYGRDNIPADISFVRSDAEDGPYAQLGDGNSVWSLSKDGAVFGFLVFSFKENSMERTIVICEAVVAACFIVSVLFFIYIDRKVIMPFNRLSDYPERIAKNENADALPESKDKYFGKYIWGMNMLRDRLSGDNRKLRQLEKEQLTLVSTIAHGIKTPVANIKLYSEAIKSGLYREDGTPDPKDAEVASKITKNADDITDLINITVDKNEDGYIFSVRDTGSRIPESEMPYVFNSFWRGSNADEVEGNGLGLYEAQFIARKLGGDIAVRYLEETEETEFEVFLPL